MVIWDYLVLAGYFAMMIGIGWWSSKQIKGQEDYFMGGRSFGKLLQTFAAFGAGTGSSDPVNTGRTTFTGGMSGMWSVMYWLFVTPFYWIAGVWYRRMRHLTLGDWFVERYESKWIGAAYWLFAMGFYMLYGSMLFSAIGKVAAPLIETDAIQFSLAGPAYPIEYVLVPVIGVIVLVYGILGGLRAAYITDLVQGVCIIVLSVILIPFGLKALIEKFGNPGDSLTMGFRYMHEQLPPEHFSIIGSTSTSEFQWHMILAVVVINLVGIVVQPHFIATGGGSAKTETTARVGLVVGNFLKRFCTVGWVLTALIALALYADSPELIADPDKTWGIASRNLLGPGLRGLMLACLLAALMSSIDAYMIVGSALTVRNIFAPVIPNATEEQYILVGRLTGVLVVGGAVIVSLFYMNVFQQLQLTWVFNVLFAAPFWVGMYWRRATTSAAWITVIFNLLIFFVIPLAAPLLMPELRDNDRYLITNEFVQTTTTRKAAPSDVSKRSAEIVKWREDSTRLGAELQDAEQAYGEAMNEVQAASQDGATPLVEQLTKLQMVTQELVSARRASGKLGSEPQSLSEGADFRQTRVSGGTGVFWPEGVKPIDADGNVLADLKPQPVGQPQQADANTTTVMLRYPDGVKLRGFGNFQLDYLLYQAAGIDLTQRSDAELKTLSLPPKIITPFLVIFLFSLITRRNSKEALDRYYAKMKTPVDPDPDADRRKLEAAYANVEELEQKKLFPGTDFEFQKPSVVDALGFVLCFGVCFAVIGLAYWVAGIGAIP